MGTEAEDRSFTVLGEVMGRPDVGRAVGSKKKVKFMGQQPMISDFGLETP